MGIKGLYTIELSGYKKLYAGKVREIFEIDEEKILLVATDRISAFDVIMNETIPDKGKILTNISKFFLKFASKFIKTHLTDMSIDDLDKLTDEEREQLRGRSLIVRKADRIDIECVVRGHIAGALYDAYSKGESVIQGIQLPDGLKKNQRLAEPIFTPTTKAESGHDEPIDLIEMERRVGKDLTEFLKNKSIEIYTNAYSYLEKKGIILADTKFEFGILNGEVIIIDEVLTPDSSRYWESDVFELGKTLPCLDKQTLRDYLNGLDWDKTPPAPTLPDEIIIKIQNVYKNAERLIIGD